MMSTTQLFPAGHYKNLYALTNNEGVMFKIVSYIYNYSNDKAGF